MVLNYLLYILKPKQPGTGSPFTKTTDIEEEVKEE